MQHHFCILIFVVAIIVLVSTSDSEIYCKIITNSKRDDIATIRSVATAYPHLAALYFQKDNETIFGCWGSLITDSFVVSVAHCMHSQSTGDIKKVRLGELSHDDLNGKRHSQEYGVSKISVHQNYSRETLSNDIALIKLEKPAKFTPYVKPICINTKKELSANEFTTLTYGADEFAHQTKIQRELFVEKVNLDECTKFLPKNVYGESYFCVLRKEPFCTISGTPVQLNNTLIGIISNGVSRCSKPLLNAKISAYASWIESEVPFISDNITIDYSVYDNTYKL